MPVPQPQHTWLGRASRFTAGYSSDQGNASGKYSATRVRSGFLGSIIAFGVRRQLTETTTVKGYISLWGTAESYARDRTQDSGHSTSKGFDVREGYVAFEGPWGALAAGRQGDSSAASRPRSTSSTATTTGSACPASTIYYPACGHIGTGALGPGNAAGFVYATPLARRAAGSRPASTIPCVCSAPGSGFRIRGPRATVSFERKLSPRFLFKLQVEGMYQYMGRSRLAVADTGRTTSLGRGRRRAPRGRACCVSACPRFGARASARTWRFRTRGPRSARTRLNFRYFTGSTRSRRWCSARCNSPFGSGRVTDDQLASDKMDPYNSTSRARPGSLRRSITA